MTFLRVPASSASALRELCVKILRAGIARTQRNSAEIAESNKNLPQKEVLIDEDKFRIA